jgi:hypothetical protein
MQNKKLAREEEEKEKEKEKEKWKRRGFPRLDNHIDGGRPHKEMDFLYLERMKSFSHFISLTITLSK